VAKPEINGFSGVLYGKAMHHEPVRTRFFVPTLPVISRTIALSDPDPGNTKSADFDDLCIICNETCNDGSPIYIVSGYFTHL
jgi:hypothetical protein